MTPERARAVRARALTVVWPRSRIGESYSRADDVPARVL